MASSPPASVVVSNQDPKTRAVNPASKKRSQSKLGLSEIIDCRALIIDGQPLHRAVLASGLREIGLEKITQCARLQDGRKAIESQTFDVVLCDYSFENSLMTGQDLLDDLRRSNLLPYSTLFIMVTGEATFHRVQEAAEAALDGYLLRPHTVATLQDRLLQAHHRKRTLSAMFQAIENGDFQTAVQLCVERFNHRSLYWQYSARVGAELMIRLGDYTGARQLYESVQSSKWLPWAQLGIARVQIEEGQYPAAERTIRALLFEEPRNADAYDLLGRLAIDRGELAAALSAYQNATLLTPFSIVRLQKYGAMAYLMGRTDDALEHLVQALKIGISSKMFDCRSLVILSIQFFDRQDRKSLSRIYDNMELAFQKAPDSPRMQRLLAFCTFFKLLMERKIDQCIVQVESISREILLEEFDFEDANNLLAALVRLKRAGATLDNEMTWVTTIAHRFCISEAASEILCLATAGQADLEESIQEGHQYIISANQKALNFGDSGDRATAARALMVLGSQTRNSKVIELAHQVLKQRGGTNDESDGLGVIINDLKTRYSPNGARIRLGAPNARDAGSITLRSPSSPRHGAPP